MTTSAKPKRKMLGAILVIGLLALVIIIDMKRRAAEDQLVKLTMRMDQLTGGNNEQNRDLAKKVIDKLGKLMVLPAGIEPTVATIVDIEKLRTQNPDFYKLPAKNGNHLVIEPTFAVIFDSEANNGQGMIVNFAPVQLTQPPAAQQGAGAVKATK